MSVALLKHLSDDFANNDKNALVILITLAVKAMHQVAIVHTRMPTAYVGTLLQKVRGGMEEGKVARWMVTRGLVQPQPFTR
jgi:hypothetical protein